LLYDKYPIWRSLVQAQLTPSIQALSPSVAESRNEWPASASSSNAPSFFKVLQATDPVDRAEPSFRARPMSSQSDGSSAAHRPGGLEQRRRSDEATPATGQSARVPQNRGDRDANATKPSASRATSIASADQSRLDRHSRADAATVAAPSAQAEAQAQATSSNAPLAIDAEESQTDTNDADASPEGAILIVPALVAATTAAPIVDEEVSDAPAEAGTTIASVPSEQPTHPVIADPLAALSGPVTAAATPAPTAQTTDGPVADDVTPPADVTAPIAAPVDHRDPAATNEASTAAATDTKPGATSLPPAPTADPRAAQAALRDASAAVDLPPLKPAPAARESVAPQQGTIAQQGQAQARVQVRMAPPGSDVDSKPVEMLVPQHAGAESTEDSPPPLAQRAVPTTATASPSADRSGHAAAVVTPVEAAATAASVAQISTTPGRDEGDRGLTDPSAGVITAASGDPEAAASDTATSGQDGFASSAPSQTALATRAEGDTPDIQIKSTLEHVAMHFGKAAKGGVQKIEITLEPAALGRIDVRLEFGKDGGINAHFVADTREALGTLRADAHALERALNDAGVKTDAGSLNFTLREHGGGAGSGFSESFARSRGRAGLVAVAASDRAPEPTLAPSPSKPGPGRIDIHA
jgi:flagellar hook-length control protein FliK